MVRYLHDPTDDAIGRIVDSTRFMNADDLRKFRDQLSEQDLYTLLQFARRQTVEALRSKRLNLALRAVSALTLVDRDKIDYRDLSVDFPLYAARQLDASTDEVIDSAIARCTDGTAEVFDAARNRVRSTTLQSCALVEVSSIYGLGFMETWTRGYNAATSIAELSVEVADAVDREGTYETAAFHATGLPDVWFSGERTSRDIPTDGCVSVDCRLIGSGRRSHGLLIFLAHLAPSASADDLAEAARQASRGDTPQVAIASGHRLALIIAVSATAGAVAQESELTLERFCDLIAPFL